MAVSHRGVGDEFTFRTVEAIVPATSIGIRILKDKEPVGGCEVCLTMKAPLPTSWTKVTNPDGVATFTAYELTNGKIVPEAVSEIPFLVLAAIPESNYGVWEDEAKFKLGELATFTLKEYKEVPTFFVRYHLRDVIGRDLFASLVAKVEEWALGWAGFKVTKIEGVGTSEVTVWFQPPWHEAPLVVALLASKAFIIAMVVLVVGIIAILVVLKWTFGEWAPPIVGLGLVVLLVVGAMVLAPRVKREARIAPEEVHSRSGEVECVRCGGTMRLQRVRTPEHWWTWAWKCTRCGYAILSTRGGV